MVLTLAVLTLPPPMLALPVTITTMLVTAVLPVLVMPLVPLVPMMLAGVPDSPMSLGASLRDRATLPSPLRGLGPSGGYPSRLRSLRSLRAPLARRLAALAAVAGPAPSRRGSNASSAGPPQSPRAGAARHARRRPRLARPGRLRRLRASPRLAAAALRASPVPASPDTALRTAPCSRARTSADTSARASASVLRTTACGSGRTAARSRAAAAPLRRVPRRRFPEPRCCRFGPSRPPGAALGLTPDASLMQGSPWLPVSAVGCPCRGRAYACPPLARRKSAHRIGSCRVHRKHTSDIRRLHGAPTNMEPHPPLLDMDLLQRNYRSGITLACAAL